MMRQSQKQLVALMLISMLAVQEAYLIQRNAATTTAALSMALIFSQVQTAMAKRENSMMGVELTSGGGERVVDAMRHQGRHAFETHDTTMASCDSDILVKFFDDAVAFGGKTHEHRILAEQYQNAGKKGFIIGYKDFTDSRSCSHVYSVKCIDGRVNWEDEPLMCNNIGVDILNLDLTLYPQKGTLFPFDGLLHQWQDVRSASEEKLTGSKYMPEFPAWTSKIQVYPVAAANDCASVQKRAKDAEGAVTGMLAGLQASDDGKKLVESFSTYASTLNSYWSAKAAVRTHCESSKVEELKDSPLIKSVVSLYARIQGSKDGSEMSETVAESKINDAIDILKATLQTCKAGDDCKPSGEDTSALLAGLWGKGTEQPDVDVGATVQEIAGLAAGVEGGPDVDTSRPSALMQSDTAAVDFWTGLLMLAGIGAVVLFAWLVITLVAAVFMFLAVHIWSIVGLLFFGFGIMFALGKVVCAQGISNENFSCKGSRSHYTAKADRLGLPRWLVGRY